MAKPRRNVKFAQRSQATTTSSEFEGRRDDMSSGSEDDEEEEDDMVVPSTPPKSQSGPTTLAQDYEKKKQTFITRTIWTLAMIAIFFGSMAAGHLYILAIVTVVQVMTFKEVIAIANVPSREKKLQFTKSLNWYFLATTMYFLYGESVIYYFKHIVYVDAFLLPFATHHRFISFILYIIGFVFFVGSLKKGHYKFQFTQFAWSHMALFLVVVQAHFIMNNIFEGMIWFFLPVSLVITNDIFAYICGITFGRTQLIKISPKKTVEGFVGAWWMTVLFGMFMTNILMRYQYFICPVKDLGANAWTGLQCTPNPVFLKHTYDLPFFMHPLIGPTLNIEPMQFHILAMATFASLVAPFGGFFASGLKRTFKIKDFGDLVPGHGGMTDRMDCQFTMGFFAYLYYQSFIAVNSAASVGSVLETAINSLSPQEQVEVLERLGRYLVGQGIIVEKVVECMNGALSATPA
ncbi:cytidylyltransferase family-domain-containing protein [Tricharina praecox]|uniref:cytidylyltransferase family-domain-containing protein n=1 Tax=Tricharina praecox TaxID=43433 RepID=UPI00221E7767|nr:cytidylyltransferase family-domain-containing protein [Tricharina praecox]KAI5853751.1 cytidylyltransferase family-domain-containing protein [Tricharina praecox]